MDNIAIKVSGLGKQYRIGEAAAYQTLRDVLATGLQRMRSRLTQRSARPTFWALKDVALEIPRGQAVSIIGRNGAGKSTLLKVLSRITAPTCGSVDLYGRVGSLLEGGTGFHPELTGRENIYLNGAILGMRRVEIERKFDEIVSFAEMEKFIDTPVKFYSSGMYMRLAFSVAAHLEPEILLVDEVLAVGDALFQKKALGKMGEVSRGGRTVLFVSHNLEAVLSLTQRGIVLNAGQVAYDGDAGAAVQFYRRIFIDAGETGEYQNPQVKVGLARARVITSQSHGIHQFGQPLEFEFELALDRRVGSFEFAFQVLNERAVPVINPRWVDVERRYAQADRVVLHCRLPASRMYMGQYTLRTFLGDKTAMLHHETVESLCNFEVVMDEARSPSTWLPGACTYIDDVDWAVNAPGA